MQISVYADHQISTGAIKYNKRVFTVSDLRNHNQSIHSICVDFVCASLEAIDGATFTTACNVLR